MSRPSEAGARTLQLGACGTLGTNPSAKWPLAGPRPDSQPASQLAWGQPAELANQPTRQPAKQQVNSSTSRTRNAVSWREPHPCSVLPDQEARARGQQENNEHQDLE